MDSMTVTLILQIAAIVLFISISAFCSSAEMALFSLSRPKVLSYRNSPQKVRRIIWQLMEGQHRTLITIIFCNMFVNSMVSMLNEQDGLYTLILRGQVDGKPSKDERIIQSVKRGLSPYEDFEGYLALAHNPDMRIIISNTTEAGIVYTGKDSFDDKPQASYPGKLTRLLYERFTAFGGKRGTGFILLPCELIDYNGRNLEECCLKTAEQWGLSEAFKTWLKEENVFCSTLVDRIVPGRIRLSARRGRDALRGIRLPRQHARHRRTVRPVGHRRPGLDRGRAALQEGGLQRHLHAGRLPV